MPGVHRNKPSKNKDFVRKTLFQVEKQTNTEPILLNSEFISKRSDDLNVFRVWKKATNKVYPLTDIYTMPFNKSSVNNI